MSSEKVYVVTYQTGGYTREDGLKTTVAGVMTDPEKARKFKIAVGGEISEIELDYVPPGYISHLQALGIDTSELQP
mgnify:CR=1 FL=1